MNKNFVATVLMITTIMAIIPITFTPKIYAASASTSDTFSLFQISDTQFLSSSYPSLFDNMTQWIVDNSAVYNVKMVVHTGDIVDNINGSSGTSSDPAQWSVANDSMSRLLNANIPYCWDAGNHDQIPWNDANGTWLGSSYAAFNATIMHSKAYWVSDIADSKNTAVRFSYNGYDFLIINIEYMATNTTLDWMKNLINTNNCSNVIVAAHTYLNKNAGYGFSSAGLPGEVAWCNNLKTILDGYPKVFLTLSGHDPTGTANMTSVGNREEIYFDRQTINSQTGAAAVRLYTFNLTSMKVDTSTYAYNITSNSWGWLTDSYNQFSFNTALNSNNWILTSNSRLLNGNPNLREYVWQKNASLSPNGLYDKIGLHRLVKTGVELKGTLFVLPGIYGSAEQLISPSNCNYTVDESSNQLVYWANRGFDVYSIDWRAHFLPLTMNSTEASINAANWGLNQYINDMKEAVDKSKEISGNSKVFLAGMSWGGAVAVYYASEYWKQDLKGLILLDGAENTAKSSTITNTYNATANINALISVNATAWENPRRAQTIIPQSGMIFAYRNALQNPDAPAEWPIGTPLQPTINPLTNKSWSNITEYIAYQQYSTNFSNIYNGYGNITVMIQRLAEGDRYWPVRLGIEANAFHDWNNCPYTTFDFDDHYQEVNVSVLAFRTGIYGVPTYGNYANGMATTDFTQITLPNYGHLDTYVGTYSAKDVSDPVYQWMISHTATTLPIMTPNPTPTPTAQPIVTAMPTSTPKPTLTAIPTTSTTPTASPPPTATPTSTPTSQPTNQQTGTLTLGPGFYVIAGIIAIVVLAAAITLVAKKRK